MNNYNNNDSTAPLIITIKQRYAEQQYVINVLISIKNNSEACNDIIPLYSHAKILK